MKKLIVISAPSGAGKTSIVRDLLTQVPSLNFSISACSRQKRKGEINGKDYYFLGVKGFQEKIAEDAFIEWEEVYKNQFYGTLKSEINRIWDLNKIAIFDVDVVGGLNLKSMYGKNCLAIFIMPPSFDVLRGRLIKRGSESDKSLNIRLDNAKKEMLRKDEFDKIIINDEFNLACMQTKKIVTKFIQK
tara:strand:- start:3402 stop:3965 length:564 start_codon:yes stop_codon:yes gene_type:complete